MNRYHTRIFAFIALAVLATPGVAFAQLEAHGIRGIGMGGSGTATVSGLDAINLNPARLVADDAGFRRLAISTGSFTVFAGGPLVQFQAYNDAFTTGAVITPETGHSIVADWFGSSSLSTIQRAGVQAQTVPLALAMRVNDWGFGVSLRSRSYGQLGINGGWVDLLLIGTAEERTLPLNGDLSVVNMFDVSVAVARSFLDGRLSVGATPRLVLGSDYSRITLDSDVTVNSTSVIHDFDYKIQSAGSINRDVLSQVNLFSADPFGNGSFTPTPFSIAGTGLGLDLGVRYSYSRNVDLAASVTDMGFVNWTGDAATYKPVNNQFRFDGIELNLDELQNQFDNDFGQYLESRLDSLARIAYEESTTEAGSFKAQLPTRIHAGASFRLLGGKATVSTGGSVAANTAPGNVSRNPSLHVGGEYRLGGRAFNVPLRGGVQVGGSGALTLAFGFGIHAGPYRMELGVAATPTTTSVGQGGRYMVGASLVNLSF